MTYFLSQVDQRVFMCLVFSERKKKGDKLICEFLYHVTFNLRNKKCFASLNG